MRLTATLILLLIATLPAYAVDTVQVDRDGITTTAVHGSAAAKEVGDFVPSTVVKTSAAACNGSTDDAPIINSEMAALSVAGGGMVKLPMGKTCAVSSAALSFQTNVTLDLNGSTLKWTGATGSTMLYFGPVQRPGLVNGFLDPGANVTTLIDSNSTWYMKLLNVAAISGTTSMDALVMRADDRNYLPNWAWGNRFFNIHDFTWTTAKRGVVYSGNSPTDAVGAVSVAAGGTGYVKGDIVDVSGGNSNATVMVWSVSGGVVTYAIPYNHGTGYSVTNNVATSGGSGTGLVLNITSSNAFKPVTNGEVYDSYGNASDKGHDFVRYADNVFLRGQTTINETANGTQCAVVNSGEPTAWNGVNNIVIDNLVCWADTTKTGQRGLVLNKSESTTANITQDPEAYWSSNPIFEDVSSRSHYIKVQSAGGSFGQKIYSKGTGMYMSPPSVYPGYKTLIQADATATADNTVTLPKNTGTLATVAGVLTPNKQATFDASGNVVASSYDTGGGSAITLQHNGINNGSQSVLNLKAGTNMTLTDNGTGQITLDATSGSTGAPSAATYIVQTTANQPTNAQALSSLSTGFLRVTTGTGVLSSDTNTYYKSGDYITAGRVVVSGSTLTSGTAAFGIFPTVTNADVFGFGGTNQNLNAAATYKAGFNLNPNVIPTEAKTDEYYAELVRPILKASSGTSYDLATYKGVSVQPQTDSGYGGTVANLYGIEIVGAAKNGGSATYTNQYGLKIQNITTGANNWAIKTGLGYVDIGDKMGVAGQITTSRSVLETPKVNGTCSTSINLDADYGNHTLTLSGACAIGVTNLTAGEGFLLDLTQSSITAPTFTAAFKWTNGTAPTWSTSATKHDLISCQSFDGSTLLCGALTDVR